MKPVASFLFVCWLLCLLASCESHFLTDESYRSRVAADLQQKQAMLRQDALFAPLADKSLTTYEREALSFLYAYMPLADITDYSPQFHLTNIRASRRAAEEMPWGKTIPEILFRHFVLPTRVNNEPLDSARVVFYRELKERVCTLSLYDAILEVNHWCHEKAIYTPSDARTSSPLATVRTAYGRCGEESTLLVAALRSVGIPARQVYTPRWAHTDDNHAWVEAWADGQWYFLGACEPEPVLNLGWFNAPASRGMLMHTKVFGRYEGTEEVMSVTPCYTEINVISNYAPTAQATVTVTDLQGRPVAGAQVDFKLYNYAEFYTVASKQTAADGTCSLTAGRGDMLVWASKDGSFGFSKLSFGQQSDLRIVLDKTPASAYTLDLDVVPPAESAELPSVTAEQRAENSRRLAQEDSIRNAYVSTFPSPDAARRLAAQYELDADIVSKLLVASRGNHRVIADFLSRLRSKASKKTGIHLLQQLSAKDLRDVTLDVLLENMLSHVRTTNAVHYRKYVLNPRVSHEQLTLYKTFFSQAISKEDEQAYLADPFRLAAWVSTNIRVEKDCNLGAPAISPAGVWRARVADAHSRDIFFVSMARSLGIPARIDEVTGKVQLITDEGAVDVELDSVSDISSASHPTKKPLPKNGKLIARYRPIKALDNPKYYSHFTISQITPQGRLQLLNYDEGDADMGSGTTWSSLLKEGTALDAGNYLLVTGTRLASGAVLSRVSSFTIEPQKTTKTDLVMRESKDDVQVIGTFNSESLFVPITGRGGTSAQVPSDGHDFSSAATQEPSDGQVFSSAQALSSRQSLLQACGRGYFVIGILGVNQEPTNHALRDIAAYKAELEQWGRPLVLLFPDEAQAGKFAKESFPDMPSTIIYGIDTDNIAAQIADTMKLKNKGSLPIFIIADTFNRVVFVSQGYTIGLGEQLMKTVNGL